MIPPNTPQARRRAQRVCGVLPLKRPALTLIELLVVLLILVALAGIIVPMAPNIFTRASTSTGATGITESAKAIIAYESMHGTFPNNWDALSDGTTLINYFANGASLPANNGSGANQAGGQVIGSTLQPAEMLALQNAGITSVQLMVATPATAPGNGNVFAPTFNNYVSAIPVSVPITSQTTLAFLQPSTTSTAVQQVYVKLNLALAGRYVLLGIGSRNDMVGKTMLLAPTNFGDLPVLNPEFGYQRPVAIFKVSDAVATNPPFTTATFVGVAPILQTGLGVADDQLQKWYQMQGGGS